MTDFTKDDVLSYSEANDVRFVRLSFCDIFGQLKNVSIAASELGRAFEEGIRFDASAIRGFLNIEDSDLLLFPEPNTLSSLSPYEGAEGKTIRLFCSILHPDMKPFEGDARYLLKSKEQSLLKKGLNMAAGTECEFYLFRLDEEGNPTLNPMDNAGYLDPSPMDKAENLRARLSQIMRGMGITIETSHHEKGPGQNEINFVSTGALSACDNQIIFKSVVKAAASRNGLFASFLPKPLADKNGNGLTVDFKLFRNEEPVFGENNDKTALSFAAGILNRAEEMCLLFNSIPNSFARLKGGDCAKEVSFSESGNRNAFMRLAVKNNAKRLELRSVDGACNIYIVVALALLAGLEGIEKEESLPSETYLPESFSAAIEAAEKGEFLRRALGEEFVSHYIRLKKDLNDAFLQNPKATEEAAFAKF